MNLQRRASVAFGLMLLLATASFAQHVKTDYDHNANFERYRTYSWASIKTTNPLDVDRIKSAVNSALAAKGWQEVPSGGDAVMFANETTKNHKTLDTFYNGFGGGWRWGGMGDATTTVENYKEGTLVVDIFGANTQKLIWRGSASDTLSSNSEKNIKNLDKGIENMFEHFPPNSAKK